VNPWIIWNAHFDGCPPVGYLLRVAAHDRWLRVYNLPNGKRYPSSKQEFAELRTRQNAVADFVLGHGATVIAWLSSYEGAPPGGEWHRAPPGPVWRADLSEALGSPEPQFYYRQLTWLSGILDPELAAVVADESGPLALFSLGTAELFCPYDGGMDLILADAARLALAKSRFRAWLSPLPSGL
jgi:hypothetical protein